MKEDGCDPNAYAYNVLMNGLFKDNQISLADKVFGKMIKRGLAQIPFTCAILIDGICRAGVEDHALKVLDKMVR